MYTLKIAPIFQYPTPPNNNIIPFMFINLLKNNKNSFLTFPKYHEFQWHNHPYNVKDLITFKNNIKLDPSNLIQ